MFIAIDIGGTKTQVAAFHQIDPKTKLRDQTHPTPQSYSQALEKLSTAIHQVSENKTIDAIGISIAKQIDDQGTVLTASKLPDYQGKSFKKDLKKIFPTKIYIANDAVCAGRAELNFGHGEQYNRLLHIIIGTGFGGSFIYRHHNQITQLAMEPASMIISHQQNDPSDADNPGSLEQHVSGMIFKGKDVQSISDQDPVWNSFINYLSIGIHNLIILLNPEIITFSGGVIQKRQFILSSLQKHLKQYVNLPNIPQLQLSSIKTNASLFGALSLCQAD